MRGSESTSVASVTDSIIGWPRMGLYILREIQLRAWHKPDFESAIFENKEYLSVRLNNFMKPLERSSQEVEACVAMRKHVADSTLKLWHYLKFAGVTWRASHQKSGTLSNLNCMRLKSGRELRGTRGSGEAE